MHSKERVVVIGGGINGLGALRSAVAAGLIPSLIFFEENDIARYSRYAGEKHFVSTGDEKGLLETLGKIAARYQASTLIPSSDYSAEFLARRADMLSGIHRVLSAPLSTVETINDKRLEFLALNDRDVSLPKTYLDLEYRSLHEARDIDVPMLIKPRTFADYSALGAKNVTVNTRDELLDFAHDHEEDIDRFLAQEIVSGAEDQLWVMNGVFDRDSRLISCFVFNRLGTMPAMYGVTSLARSCSNSRIRELAETVGSALGVVGAAMIEFKYCQKREEFIYIETNPRLGMCNWFDTCCGVNNVLAFHLTATGRQAICPEQRDNVYWLNALGHLVSRIEDGKLGLSGLRNAVFLFTQKTVFATWKYDDVLPSLTYTYALVKSLVKRLLKRARSLFRRP